MGVRVVAGMGIRVVGVVVAIRSVGMGVRVVASWDGCPGSRY
jgi:hypothetical protein